MAEWIYGRRTVAEHLREAPSTCRKLTLARGSRPSPEIEGAARGLEIPVEIADRRRLDRLCRGGNHQGVCLEVDGWSYEDLEALVARARSPGHLPLILALDSIQDPRNLGAILRVADGVGAAGVVVPADRSAGLSAAVARTAAGALASVPVARVVNLARALREVREHGFTVLGAAGDAETRLHQTEARFPSMLVLGGEGQGLRPNVAANCDALVSLPMAGAVSSLNVAVAAGVFCYELLRQWGLRGGS